MELQVVHVRINDAASGQPTPVRIRFVDPDGRYRAPLGRLATFPTGFGAQVGGNVLVEGKEYAYIDGQCEILLPTGPIRIEVHKGLEYAPVSHAFDRQPGQISLRLAIERRFNLEADGWYAGDVQAHFLTPQAAWLEAAAEGLHVVDLLAAEWEDDAGQAFHSNLLDFTGQIEPPKKDGTLVAVNTLNRGGSHGDFLLLNCHRIVHPLRLGQPGFEQYRPIDWFRQCHRKGGRVVSTRFLSDAVYHQDPTQWSVNAFVWTPDTSFVTETLPQWYAHLNRGEGAGLALVGGSGKTSNGRTLGAVRTYARIGGEDRLNRVNYRAWIHAISTGATFATRGPLLELQVRGVPQGGLMAVSARSRPPVRARARSLTPFTRLDIVCNGEVIADAAPNAENVAEIDIQHAFTERSWLVARCWGPGSENLLAHTSPLQVAVMG